MQNNENSKVQYGQVFEIDGVKYIIVKKTKYCDNGRNVLMCPTVINLNESTILSDSFGKKIINSVSDLTPTLLPVVDITNPAEPYYPNQ